MKALHYQRQVLGYHGCDRSLCDLVLTGGARLRPSRNDHDWLGEGLYFWEFGPERAMEWAIERKRKKTGEVKDPAVLGSIIHLGNCFDLLDVRNTLLLRKSYQAVKALRESEGKSLPQNEGTKTRSQDLVLRKLDCEVLNLALPILELEMGIRFDSVRGMFSEGDPVFPGSKIDLKSHIQIAVRNPDCVVGYFLPEGLLQAEYPPQRS